MDALKCQIIVNELLSFVNCKKSIMTNDDMATLCLNSFSEADITEAKKVLMVVAEDKQIPQLDRFKTLRGPLKNKRNLEDTLVLLHELNSGDEPPKFAAVNLNKLPPVGFDSIDVSNLMHRIQTLEVEVAKVNSSLQRQLHQQIKNDHYPTQGHNNAANPHRADPVVSS